MIDTAVGVILNYILFALIGAGPSLWLSPTRGRLENLVATAPVIGFCLTGIIGVYLTLLDRSVSVWAVPWLVVAICLSAALLFASYKGLGNSSGGPDHGFPAVYPVALVIVFVLLSAPLLLGGLQFTMLRGNGGDSFLYMTIAGYLDHEPYSWIFNASVGDAFNLHPSYPEAQDLLKARWATSLMLAWTARIAGTPLVEFEYGFTLIPLLLAFGPAFLLAREMGTGARYAALAASAVCTGFWPQLVLDVRAMSQLCGIPILLLLALALIRIEGEVPQKDLKPRFLLSICTVSIIFHYPEILPVIALGLAFFICFRVLHGFYAWKMISRYLPSAALTVVMAIPLGRPLIGYLAKQMSFAASGSHNWHLAYFGWFYANPFIGLWGLSTVSEELPKAPFTLLGIILTVVLCIAIISVFISGKKYEIPYYVIASFAAASVSVFFYLLASRQLWAAGKALSFGYPFFILLVTAFALASPRAETELPYKITYLLKIAISLFLVCQFISGVLRIGYVAGGKEYSNYIGFHGEHKKHDWDIKPLREYLNLQGPGSVGIAVYDGWMSEYLGLALGWDRKLVNFGVFGSDLGRGWMLVPPHRAKPPAAKEMFRDLALPDYLIVTKTLWFDKTDLARFTVASNSEVALMKPAPVFWSKPSMLALFTPYGFDPGPDGPAFWMGGPDRTLLRLYAPQEGEITLKARFAMGPSLAESDVRTVEVFFPASGKSENVRISTSSGGIRVPVAQGMNDIGLRVLDEPSLAVLPNGDRRPLLLRVSTPGLEWKSTGP